MNYPRICHLRLNQFMKENWLDDFQGTNPYQSSAITERFTDVRPKRKIESDCQSTGHDDDLKAGLFYQSGPRSSEFKPHLSGRIEVNICGKQLWKGRSSKDISKSDRTGNQAIANKRHTLLSQKIRYTFL